MIRNSMALVVALVIASLTLAAQDSNFADWSDAQKEEFLLGSEVTERHSIDVGVTGSRRLTLARNGVSHDAHFQSIEVTKPIFESPQGRELNFRDSYQFNIAAYRLDRLIGLNLVPVSVPFKDGRTSGAATWWVDNVKMMERDRRKNGAIPPNQEEWNDQMYNIRVFNELVYNTDPNLGNVLITNDWLPVAIDFTRAFRRQETLRHVENLVKVDRRVYEGLKDLSEDALTASIGRFVSKPELRAILARRDAIVAVFDRNISEQGVSAVICDRPGH
jgi:hypothetical protein